jgi:hypothetical protein
MAGYGTWFLSDGYRRDPAFRAAAELVAQDGLVHLVLGRDAAVTGIEGNAFSFVPGMGASNAAILRLEGSKGSGTLAVTSHTQAGQTKFDSMVLTGPDGQRYDLLNHNTLPDPMPANPSQTTNSI